jgi:hypothetical protein
VHAPCRAHHHPSGTAKEIQRQKNLPVRLAEIKQKKSNEIYPAPTGPVNHQTSPLTFGWGAIKGKV